MQKRKLGGSGVDVSAIGVPFGAMASGDMNGDGYPDLVVLGGTTAKALHVLLNRGAMAFDVTTVLPIWTSASAITAGDFDVVVRTALPIPAHD